MNTLFNLLMVAEVIAILFVLALHFAHVRQHLHSSLCALIIALPLGYVNAIWFYRFGCIHDTFEMINGLALILFALVAADGRNQKIEAPKQP